MSIISGRGMTPVPGYQYIHGCTYSDRQQSFMVVNIKDVKTNESSLQIIDDIVRPFYVTQEGLRNDQNEKIEYAHVRDLTMYMSSEHELVPNVGKALGMLDRGWWRKGDVYSSPYVYGADIHPEVILKHSYRKQGDTAGDPTVGSLDIETNITTNEIIACTFVNSDHQCYSAILKSFLQGHTADDVQHCLDDIWGNFYKGLKPDVQEIVDKQPFKYNFFVADTELALIKWIWARIHECKPDFLITWNGLQFDMPRLIARLEFRGACAADVMCHPDVPKRYRICEIKLDHREVQHFTDVWHWMNLSGYTQPLDSMCLYSRLRKVKGRDISYKLDYIATKELGVGKLEFGEASGSHQYMQANKPVEYSAYNVIDCVLLVLMDKLNNDVASMCELVDNSRLSDFAKQTTQLKNMFYDYLQARNCVPASVAGSIETEYDDLTENLGGAVLDPNRARNTGVRVLQELPNHISFLNKLVSDIDVSSMYPSLVTGFNVAKETKLSTCLEIVGLPTGAIAEFFGLVTSPSANSIRVCHKYFGLPTYMEMLDEYKKIKAS